MVQAVDESREPTVGEVLTDERPLLQPCDLAAVELRENRRIQFFVPGRPHRREQEDDDRHDQPLC